jgi:hypothetical protein
MNSSIRPLAQTRMRPAEASWRTHAVLVESDVMQATLLVPGFWANVASRLRPLDRLEVMDDGANWLCVLLVRAVSEREAVVAPLWRAELQSAATLSEPVGDAMRPRWGGFGHRWTVVQGDAVLRSGMASREEAETWLRSHLKALAG